MLGAIHKCLFFDWAATLLNIHPIVCSRTDRCRLLLEVQLLKAQTTICCRDLKEDAVVEVEIILQIDCQRMHW